MGGGREVGGRVFQDSEGNAIRSRGRRREEGVGEGRRSEGGRVFQDS